MYELTIKGFKTKDEVEAFIHWYESEGEQYASTCLEMEKDEGKDVRTFLETDCGKTFNHPGYFITWENNTAFMFLK